MIGLVILFFIIALVAALLGFTTIAGTAMAIAKILFIIFLILFIISLIMYLARRR